jgi:hypothetical protein
MPRIPIPSSADVPEVVRERHDGGRMRVTACYSTGARRPGCCAAWTTPVTIADEQPAATESETTEAPKQTGPATAKLGETLSFEDSFGKHSADITITRKRVSTGGEFDKPSRGYYVGLFVRVKAFQDGISVPQFYALVGAKHFDQTFTTGFEPDLNVVGNLNQGETTEGWVVFDVPSRNGKAVVQEFASEKAQATWSY